MRPLALLALVTACAPEPPSDNAHPSQCDGSLAPGDVVVVAQGFDKSEGLAFSPDGRLFITAGDVVAEVHPDGSWEPIADLAGGVGLAWWGDSLYAAGYPNDVGSVVQINVDTGTVSALTEAIEAPNFLTVTPWGTLLVSDADQTMWEVQPDGATALWLAYPGPNGAAFTQDQSQLWVVSTWDTPAPVSLIDISGHTAGEVTQVHAYEGGNFPDGVALGHRGDLYVSLNVAGQINRLSPEGAADTAAEGVDFTASIAFGEGPDWDPCALYSTSLFGDKVFAAGVGEPGVAPIR